jgi:hypothetical protein
MVFLLAPVMRTVERIEATKPARYGNAYPSLPVRIGHYA